MTNRTSNTAASAIFLVTATGGMLLGVACWTVVAFQHGGSRAVAGHDPVAQLPEVKSNAPAALSELTSAEEEQKDSPESDDSEWLRPDTGGLPAWLVTGGEAEKRLGNVAASLENYVTAQYEGVPLTELVRELSDQAGVSIVINSTELDAFGVEDDSPVLVKVGGKTTLREVLRTALAPIELTWQVSESGLVITSIDDANMTPLSRVYDLTYVLPNASNREHLMNLIQQTVTPDSWLSNGGSSSLLPIGSCLVISAPEVMHHEVAKLLHSLSAMNPANLRMAPPVPEYPQPMGGMGGGGMGMGMGGGMGGGMFRSGPVDQGQTSVGTPVAN